MATAEWLLMGLLVLVGATAAFSHVAKVIHAKGSKVADLVRLESETAPAGELDREPAQSAGPGSLLQSVTRLSVDVVTGTVHRELADGSSAGALAGHVALGSDLVLDARDAVAAIKGVYIGEQGAWTNLGISAAALVPFVHDFAKAALQRGSELGDRIAQHADRLDDDQVRSEAEIAVRGADAAHFQTVDELDPGPPAN